MNLLCYNEECDHFYYTNPHCLQLYSPSEAIFIYIQYFRLGFSNYILRNLICIQKRDCKFGCADRLGGSILFGYFLCRTLWIDRLWFHRLFFNSEKGISSINKQLFSTRLERSFSQSFVDRNLYNK